MGGTKRLTWVTALTLAGLMLGASVVGAVAKEHPGRGHGQSSWQSQGHHHGPANADSEDADDLSLALVTGPGKPTGAARPCPDEVSEVADFDWRNHGHYVSCVARGLTPVEDSDDAENHGSTVREAAHSDIGKSGKGE